MRVCCLVSVALNSDGLPHHDKSQSSLDQMRHKRLCPAVAVSRPEPKQSPPDQMRHMRLCPVGARPRPMPYQIGYPDIAYDIPSTTATRVRSLLAVSNVSMRIAPLTRSTIRNSVEFAE